VVGSASLGTVGSVVAMPVWSIKQLGRFEEDDAYDETTHQIENGRLILSRK